MAISRTHYELFRSLPLPRGGTLLEIGEANWYGDLDPRSVGLLQTNQHDLAKEFYAQTFAPEKTVAIDMNGTKAALRYDLNRPVPIDEQFDVVINHGTAEHVFNIGQVFQTMHDRCHLGGLTIHDAPFTGWVDHGFYTLQPTLFYDLAHANCYEIVLVAVHDCVSGSIVRLESRDDVHRRELPPNAMLFVVFKKRFDLPFKVPMQGYYGGGLSLDGVQAWEKKGTA